jgi:hypothetical protein
VPTEIEGGVGREAGDQNGQSDEIRIVSSGNDHRDRSNWDQESNARRIRHHMVGQTEPAAKVIPAANIKADETGKTYTSSR